jgi:hypothetical protein
VLGEPPFNSGSGAVCFFTGRAGTDGPA